MANEFKVRKGLIVDGNSVISGSETATGGFIGNLTGTADTASYYAGSVVTASYAETWNSSSILTLIDTKQDTLVTGDTYSITSSWAENSISSSHSLNADNAITSAYASNADNAENASTADYATNAGTAGTASYYGGSVASSSYAQSSSHALVADNVVGGTESSSYATYAETANIATSAETASYLSDETDGYLAKWNNNTVVGSTTIYDAGSQIGIGIAAPSGKLHVASGVLPFITLQNSSETTSSSAYKSYVSFTDSNGNQMGYVGVNAANHNSMSIWSNYGNVAIGGNNKYKVHVSGDGVGISNAGPLAPLHVGGRNINNSSDAVILISRNVANDVAGNGHAFSDSSLINRSGVVAYNSFDCRVDITGSNYDHYAGLQFAPTIDIAGSIAHNYGVYTTTTLNNGNIGNHYGLHVYNPTVNAGSITNNYGLFIWTQNAGSNNFNIWSGDGAHYFGGNTGIGTTNTTNNKLHVSGSTWLEGDVTASINGTASYSNTSSYAETANTLLGSVESASYASTASLLLGSVESASYAENAASASLLKEKNTNIGIGNGVLSSVVSGSGTYNIAIGRNAANTLTTGDFNIAIGYDVDLVNTWSAHLNLGNMIYANGMDGTGTTPSSGKVGIKVADPTTFDLQVAGNVGPNSDSTYNLGSSGTRWLNVYADNITGSGDITFPQLSPGYLLRAVNNKLINSTTMYDAGSQIGIGTTSVFGKLNVASGVVPYAVWKNSSYTTGSNLYNFYHSFYDSNDNQAGFIGYGSTSHNKMQIYNDAGGIQLYSDGQLVHEIEADTTTINNQVTANGFTGSLAGSASYAVTASYSLNGGGGGYTVGANDRIPKWNAGDFEDSLIEDNDLTVTIEPGLPGYNALHVTGSTYLDGELSSSAQTEITSALSPTHEGYVKVWIDGVGIAWLPYYR